MDVIHDQRVPQHLIVDPRDNLPPCLQRLLVANHQPDGIEERVVVLPEDFEERIAEEIPLHDMELNMRFLQLHLVIEHRMPLHQPDNRLDEAVVIHFVPFTHSTPQTFAKSLSELIDCFSSSSRSTHARTGTS